MHIKLKHFLPLFTSHTNFGWWPFFTQNSTVRGIGSTPYSSRTLIKSPFLLLTINVGETKSVKSVFGVKQHNYDLQFAITPTL